MLEQDAWISYANESANNTTYFPFRGCKRSRQHFQLGGAELALTTGQQTPKKKKQPTCCSAAVYLQSCRNLPGPPVVPAAPQSGLSVGLLLLGQQETLHLPSLRGKHQDNHYFQPGIFRRRLSPLQETDGGDTQIHTHKRTASLHHKMTGCVGSFLLQSADGCEGFFCSFPLFFSFNLEKQVEVLQWYWLFVLVSVPTKSSISSKFPLSEKVAVIYFTIELNFASQKGEQQVSRMTLAC